MIEQQLALFDYGSLDLETRVLAQADAARFTHLMKQTAANVIEMGFILATNKARLKHGNFQKWVEIALNISMDTAQNFMRVAEVFGEMPNSSVFAPKVMYLLAKPSTPEFAREEAIARAETGEQITYSTAKGIVDYHKEQVKQLEPEILTFDEWVNQPITPFEVEGLPDPTPEPAPLQPQSMGLLTSSLNDSWRTPAKYIEAAREVLGGIDLDPASSAIANETIKAKYFLTKEDNGLNHPWFGKVWINPPYGKTNNLSNQGLFAHKLIQEYMEGRVTAGIILINLYVGYGWFAPLRELHRCEVDHRITFINPSTDEEGDEAKASSVFIYVGSDHELFYKEFSQFGVCGQLKYYK